MKPRLALVAFLACFLRLPAEPVDLLLIHGTIYTANDAAPRAEAVAVRDGRIVYVGGNAGAEAFRAEAKRVIDLGGKTLLPGLNDAHMHLGGVGLRELSFDLEGVKSVAELREKLKARAAQTAPKKWIVGRGWIETHWAPPVFPSARDLDDVAPDHPVVLTRSDGHAMVVNRLALKLAGIDRNTPNPTGGEILRDSQTGEATGMLIDNAMSLVYRLVPSATEAEVAHAFVVGAEREAALGWTGVQIAGHSYQEAELVRRLVAEGKIKLRVYDAVSGPGPDAAKLARTPGTAYGEDTAAWKLFADGPVLGESRGRYTRRSVKLYIDGALGSRGAALLEPYADSPGSRGLVMQTEADLLPFLEDALRRGIQIQTHAIGDRGNRLMLDLYEKALAAVPVVQRKVAEPRWRMEHAQILSLADIPRFAQLGVIASMQPSHAIGDLYFAPSRLGKERLAGAYPWQALWRSGAVFTAGSDAPVERGEPMIEFYAAVARRSLDGFANDDWHLEQRLTRAQALRAMTLNAAYATFEEKERGSIEAGKWADFTVLSADIMQIPEAEILKTRCLLTIVGGEVIYEAR
ncbi:MAG: amidohydrolase [Opitutae bacterium]|nr:amidohydrolase [Opitutae bacterium]